MWNYLPPAALPECLKPVREALDHIRGNAVAYGDRFYKLSAERALACLQEAGEAIMAYQAGTAPRSFADGIDEVHRLLEALRQDALLSCEQGKVQAVAKIQGILSQTIESAPDGGVAQVTQVYRQAIEGILDLPFAHAEVHNRYLHFVLDHGRMPNMLESQYQINMNHARFYGHPFVQAEGLTPGQCCDCLEDAEGTQYGPQGATEPAPHA